MFNHTSFDSEWLLEDELSYYSLKNTQQLVAAYILDRALSDFSQAIKMKAVNHYPKGNVIENEQDVDLLLKIFKDEILPPL